MNARDVVDPNPFKHGARCTACGRWRNTDPAAAAKPASSVMRFRLPITGCIDCGHTMIRVGFGLRDLTRQEATEFGETRNFSEWCDRRESYIQRLKG